MNAIQRQSCTGCGAAVSDMTPDKRVPCSRCGSFLRTYSVTLAATVVARPGVRLKARRAGIRRPFLESKSVPDFWRKARKWMSLLRVIDRERNRYVERVSDPTSGEIVCECEEPLSQHRGHGSARAPGNPAR